MEKKTKHRILGTLVVIGAIIIMLPFLQSNQPAQSEAKLIKAPPFPDQSVQVSPTSTDNHLAGTFAETKNPSSQPLEDTISVDRPSVAQPSLVNSQAAPILPPPNQIEIPPAPQPEKVAAIKAPVKTAAIKTRVEKVKKKEVLPMANDNNGLVKLKNAAWVIQLGNFSNKASALRLVNHLRLNGYRAFMQQVSTSYGNSTRVFVGPEYKQTSAHALASRLETEVHIRGAVISYQPFAM